MPLFLRGTLMVFISISVTARDLILSMKYEVFHSTWRNKIQQSAARCRKGTRLYTPCCPLDPTKEHFAVTLAMHNLKFTSITCYIPPGALFNKLRLQNIINTTLSPHIITRDSNGHNTAWDSKYTSVRGRTIADMADQFNLIVLNDGSPTSFQGSSVSGCLDITLASQTRGKP